MRYGMDWRVPGNEKCRCIGHVAIGICLMLLLMGMPCQAAKADVSKRAQQILKTMSWKEKLAQMFIVAVPRSDAAKVQKNYQFGGYIFFESDFRTRSPQKTKQLIQKIQKKSKVEMLIAVDEEGGTVNRVSKVPAYRSTPFASPQAVYQKGGYPAIRSDAAEKAKLLKKLGINTNFAPVADTPYKKTDFMYSRSFSTDAASVSKYIKTVVKEMKSYDVVSTLKHFPGYGGNGDTHTSIIRDTRSKKTFESRDLKPFAAGIKAGCDMIMVSHNIVNAFDSSKPASLSKKVHNYLRNTMKFDGVIITDDLVMDGVAKFAGSSSKAAVQAILAGNDMIITTSYKSQFDAVCKAFKNKEISRAQVNASVKRILIMKLNRGIIR